MNKKPIMIAISAASIGLVGFAIYWLRKKNGGQNMNISDNGLNAIKKYEGCRLTAYQDVKGVWTIGYGHTGDVYYGETITQSEADALFRNDIQKFVKGVNSLLGSTRVNQNQFDALVSFAYNCGLTALKNSTLLRKVKADPNDPTIETEFKKWVYSGGKYIQGLANRRASESKLYFA